ncbi:secreted antigen 1 [Babesia divergens]|uniref:Secreted antigen 1 n=1 Tax=Babesia divergens TaxID=32595 RepID=A0AAD9LI51_BABDI|nr:secreted antigen 1 [Babesia divergens]
MKFLGIFRAVALLSFAFGITGQLISCRVAPTPLSLKDIFDFIDKLSHTPDVRKKVFENLNRKVATFCNYGDKFWRDLYGNNSEGYISDVFNSVSAIRGLIDTRTGEYGHYSDITLSLYDASRYEEIIAKKLPHLYSALYFVYFNGSKKDCGSINGGQWENLRCNEIGNNQYFGKWLSDQVDTKFPRQSIERGFSNVGNLGSTTGQDVADQIKSAVNHIAGGSLQNALYGMLFLGSWHDAKTGHALRFIHEFAINVLNDKFQTHPATKYTAGGFDTLKVVCRALKEKLDVFVGTTANHFYAVSSRPTQHYPDLIKIEAFDAYVDWMEKHIVSIIGSLNSMARDALNWKINNIVETRTSGPFKYGLVFKDGLNEDTFETTIKAYSAELINNGYLLMRLLTELRRLKMVERYKPPTNGQIDGSPESIPTGVPTGTVPEGSQAVDQISANGKTDELLDGDETDGDSDGIPTDESSVISQTDGVSDSIPTDTSLEPDQTGETSQIGQTGKTSESDQTDVPTGTVPTQPEDSQAVDETSKPEEPTEASEKKSSAAMASSVACFSMLGLLVSMI